MINIAFGLDNNFAPHCAASMASILSNHKILSDEDKIHFFFFGNLDDDNKEKLLSLKEIQDFESDFIGIDCSEFSKLPLRNGQQVAIYNVLLIPNLLPQQIKKVIVLDCDTIVNTDISQLWKIDIKSSLVAAVKDNYMGKRNYFNSGVMALNVPKLREFGFYEKWKEYVKYNVEKMTLHDQDILNPVLMSNIFYLPVNWNVHHGIFLTLYDKYGKKDIDSFLSFCYIVHYSTKIKPWHPLPVHPLKCLYFKYAAMTPWKNKFQKHSFYAKTKSFLRILLKYWFVHPAFMFKPKFWRKIKQKGWLMTLY
ncbi:MAG: glycosyltransferase family 8 protein [Endomicrobium sp.]|jgi:lipopolysaccharide biosynthesis glycosyltransferase|nr:glycosyltransferase family 8 protein [Endomicrobium sp.]